MAIVLPEAAKGLLITTVVFQIARRLFVGEQTSREATKELVQNTRYVSYWYFTQTGVDQKDNY